MEHKKTNFWLLENREQAHLFQGNKGTGTPPPPKRASEMNSKNWLDLHGQIFGLNFFCDNLM